MKLSFAVSLSIIALMLGAASCDDLAPANVLYNPGVLFQRAIDYQARVTALQEDIVVTITGLRSQLSNILKRTSNTTLSQVQDNIWDIFQMDAPYRQLLFIDNPTTDCILNLRWQLNMVTEFSGFDSSNCLTRYDRSVNALIGSAIETLAVYEGKIRIIQMLVLNSFVGFNVWIEPEDIEAKFRSEYDVQKAAWDAVKAGISQFLASLEADIGTHNGVLHTCFVSIQTGLGPRYTTIANGVSSCTEFDN